MSVLRTSGLAATTSSWATLSSFLDELLAGPAPWLSLEPIIHLQTGAEVGVEALARFDGPLPTDAVFRLAHAEGIGNDLELRCLHRVLKHLHATNSTDVGFVAVNLSPAALIDPRCLELIGRYECRRLVIELTDHTAAPEIAVLRRYLEEARDHQIRIGVHVSTRIDHDLFAIIHPDIAKIDVRSPTWHTIDDDNTELARYLSRLGAFVVAVGVHSRDTLTHLRRHGIDAAQGHMIGLPRTVDRS